MDYLKIWLLASVYLVVTGWVLSSVGMLNLAGYSIAGVVGLVVLFNTEGFRHGRLFLPHFFKLRRFTRLLPSVFLLIAFAALLGGILYPPNNYDAMTYRIPRVLHWLSEQRWHWIVTPNERMNYSGTGFEWIITPLLVFAKSDRFFFLINLVPYLLMPGLVFSVFCGLGVRARVACFWMWLLPASYCFAMQAGGIGNDALSVVYFLASLHFILKARKNSDIGALWLGILAAALFTGVKASNLPLLLPIALAILPLRHLLMQHWGKAFGILAIAAIISFLPTALFNHHFSGNFFGDPENRGQMKLSNPSVGVLGNGLQLATQCLMPPLLPSAEKLSAKFISNIPEPVLGFLKKDFPRFNLCLNELPQEESAGLGFGIASLLGLSFFVGLQSKTVFRGIVLDFRFLIVAGGWIASAVYMMKMGSEATARLMAPYYPLLVVPFLYPESNARLVTKPWWHWCAACAAGSVLFALILTPSRPLWSAGSGTKWLNSKFYSSHLTRAERAYLAYAARNDALAPVRNYVPSQVRDIGLIADVDDPEMSLWRPYGSRRVIHLVNEDHALVAGQTVPEWVVIKRSVLGPLFPEWLASNGGQLMVSREITTKLRAGPEEWCLVQFPSTGPGR